MAPRLASAPDRATRTAVQHLLAVLQHQQPAVRIGCAAVQHRGDGDPERALRLLESSEKVGGPLAEEALALRIEAATAGGNPRAQSLARSYLSRYPSGRYRELARRALADH
jgi:hypothetical protein